MKKVMMILLCLALSSGLVGCGGEPHSSVKAEQKNVIIDVLAEEMEKEDSKMSEEIKEPEEDEEPKENREQEESIEKKDSLEQEESGEEDDNDYIDLTALSSTMVFSEVYNMMMSPAAYKGKTVRMEGMFVYFHDDKTGKDYYSCIISDATACCSQGMEFVPPDDIKYPDDFPEDGDDICVEGVFDTYEEEGNTYCTLRNAAIIR